MAFQDFRDDAIAEIEKALGAPLDDAQREAILRVIEGAIVKSVDHTHDRHVETMLEFPLVDQDKAHKLADELERAKIALIANLSAQR